MRPLPRLLGSLWFSVALVALSGCGDDGSAPLDGATPDGAIPDGAMVDGAMDGAPDSGLDGGTGPACGVLPALPTPVCGAQATDYSPGVDDMWPACISDDGAYHRIQDSISSIARVAAFEQIATLLFDPTTDPSSDDFLAARLLYQEDQGLDSRVVRRYDPHYEVPDGTDCTADGVPAMFPDYCVGPARIGPLVLRELNAGIDGSTEVPRLHAARVEAGLLWFLYVSTYKEATTCTTTPKDCDSAYAYYTGGETARGGLGLSRYVAEADAEAHDRAWDGALGLRCWRDLDSEPMALDLPRRDLARRQYDTAILDGVAAIVRARLARLCEVEGDELAYHWAFLEAFGAVLDREATSRDATQAAALRTELGRSAPADVDVSAALTALDALFECP